VLEPRKVFRTLITKPEGMGILGDLGVNYTQHDVTEMRCAVMFETEMYKMSRISWLVVVKTIMEDVGRCHEQKFRLYIYE